MAQLLEHQSQIQGKKNGEEWIFSILFGFDKSHRMLFQSRVIRSSNNLRQKIYRARYYQTNNLFH